MPLKTDDMKSYMKAYMKQYQQKSKQCECCKREIKLAGWYKHVKTPKHLSNKQKYEPVVIMREEEMKQLNDKIKNLEESLQQLREQNDDSLDDKDSPKIELIFNKK